MSAPTGVFQLQFSPSEIKSLSSNYKLDQEEHAAFDAGARILSGDFNRKNLDPIFRWKVRDRGKSRPLLNTDEELSDALQLAVLAKTPRAAISVLTGLSGVAVPVASAIMTAIKPEYYTIIDFRALEVLPRAMVLLGKVDPEARNTPQETGSVCALQGNNLDHMAGMVSKNPYGLSNESPTEFLDADALSTDISGMSVTGPVTRTGRPTPWNTGPSAFG